MESVLEYFKQMETKSDGCEVLSAGPVLVQSLEAAAAVDQTQDVQHPTLTFSPGEISSISSNPHKLGEIHSVKQKSTSMQTFMNTKPRFGTFDESYKMTKIDVEFPYYNAVSLEDKSFREEMSLPVPGQYEKDEKCPVCMNPIIDPYTFEKCGHTSCSDCIRQTSGRCAVQCPVCGELYGPVTGDQPEGGMMTNQTLTDVQIAGYKGARGTISIEYYLPGGVQKEKHPNPGMRYTGIRRTAYLPNNAEGQEVLKLFEKAFKAGLVFTIGNSRTTGQNDVIIWNGIHHKTSLTGGPEYYGYPDPDYLRKVKEELVDKGITG